MNSAPREPNTARETNSEPLSDRKCAGTPRHIDREIGSSSWLLRALGAILLSFSWSGKCQAGQGYLSKDQAPEDILRAVHTVLAGRRFVSEALSEMLVDALDEPTDRPLHASLSQRESKLVSQERAWQPLAEEDRTKAIPEDPPLASRLALQRLLYDPDKGKRDTLISVPS